MKTVENQIKQYSCVMCSSIYDGNNAISPTITKCQIDKNKTITKNAKEYCISNNLNFVKMLYMSVNTREHEMTEHPAVIRLQHNNKPLNSDDNIKFTIFEHLYDSPNFFKKIKNSNNLKNESSQMIEH